MKICCIHARELQMELLTPFETSFGTIKTRRIVLLEIETDESTGWGELTTFETPSYNSEFTDSAWLVLRKFLAPIVLGCNFLHPEEINARMESVRGHEMAKGAIETACWDAFAKARSVSLASALGATRSEIACGVSLGLHASPEALLDTVASELANGYQRIKLKIKPGRDVDYVAAVRNRYPDIQLTVDANSAYRLEDLPTLKRLDSFELEYIEQPLQWNEIYDHAHLQRQLKTAICLDECIHNLRDAQAAVHLGACKVINIKLGRVAGHTEAKRIQSFCSSNGIPVWSGGMLEAGVGRAQNVAMSALPGFTLPGDVASSSRYWHQDIVEPAIKVNERGAITLTSDAGLGYAIDRKRIEAFTVAHEVWKL